MRTVHLFIVALSLLSVSSCCGGSDQINYNYALDIVRVDDTSGELRPISGRFYDKLELQTLSRHEEGTRNCHLKNMVMETRESIDTSSVVVYCNRDIKSHGISIPAGSNIYSNQQFRLYEYYRTRIALEIDTADVMGNVPYTYYVKGNTSMGNIFTDSVAVTYIK